MALMGFVFLASTARAALGHTAPNPRLGAPQAARRWRRRSSPTSAPPAPLAATPAPARPTPGQQGASRPRRWDITDLHRSRRPGRRHANPRLAWPVRHVAGHGVLATLGPCTTLAASVVAARPTPRPADHASATALRRCAGRASRHPRRVWVLSVVASQPAPS